MLQLEDNIDLHKIISESYINKFNINYNNVQDIKTFIYGLACPNTFNVVIDVASVKSMILKNFIFLPYFKFVIYFNSIYCY